MEPALSLTPVFISFGPFLEDHTMGQIVWSFENTVRDCWTSFFFSSLYHLFLPFLQTWTCTCTGGQMLYFWQVELLIRLYCATVLRLCFSSQRDLFTHTPWKKRSWRWSNRSEKAMAPHSSTLAWKIPWMEEPGRLQSMGSLRVGYHWATSLSLFTFMHWRRKWQPTPVFLPGESQGRGSLVGRRLWGRTECRTLLKRLSSSSK